MTVKGKSVTPPRGLSWSRFLLALAAACILWVAFDLITARKLAWAAAGLWAIEYLVIYAVVIPLIYLLSRVLARVRVAPSLSFPVLFLILHAGLFFTISFADFYSIGGRALVLDGRFTAFGWTEFARYAGASLIVGVVISLVLDGARGRQPRPVQGMT